MGVVWEGRCGFEKIPACKVDLTPPQKIPPTPLGYRQEVRDIRPSNFGQKLP